MWTGDPIGDTLNPARYHAWRGIITVPWRQSRRRRFRKGLVALFGRKPPRHPPGWQPQPQRVPTYTRPGIDERLDYVEHSERGWSARKIARRFCRDHHTVLRALAPRRLESLAKNLAFKGREDEAIDLATQIGDPELLAWVRDVLRVVLNLQGRRVQNIEMALDAL